MTQRRKEREAFNLPGYESEVILTLVLAVNACFAKLKQLYPCNSSHLCVFATKYSVLH